MVSTMLQFSKKEINEKRSFYAIQKIAKNNLTFRWAHPNIQTTDTDHPKEFSM